MRDNRSGKIIRPAPLFDHGLSLLCHAIDDDLADIAEYSKTRTTPYPGVSFESIVSAVCGKTRAAQLRRLVGFIERDLQHRVRRLLELNRQKELPLRRRMEHEETT